jgi:hypothetical protein
MVTLGQTDLDPKSSFLAASPVDFLTQKHFKDFELQIALSLPLIPYLFHAFAEFFLPS